MNHQPAIYVLITILSIAILFLGLAQSTIGQNNPKLVKAKDGSGIIGYKDTPILPRCGYHVHCPDRSVPKKVTFVPPNEQGKAGFEPAMHLCRAGTRNLGQET